MPGLYDMAKSKKSRDVLSRQAPVSCDVGLLSLEEHGVVSLVITLQDREISGKMMQKAVGEIDRFAGRPRPLLVDMNQPHSLSFQALREMTKATNVVAVGLFALPGAALHVAEYIRLFQEQVQSAHYPFRVFADKESAEKWLASFCSA